MLDPNLLNGVAINDRFVLLSCLGTGSFGAVYAADEVLDGERIGTVAVKFCRPQSEDEREALFREVRTMAGLSHAHVLGYRGAGRVWHGPLEGCIYLAMECAEQSLYETIAREPDQPVGRIRALTRDLCRALSYLHTEGIVHRDVNPDNILRVGGRWKLGDFGLARTLDDLRQRESLYGGTVPYLAPEVVDHTVGTGVDMWAVGVILQVMLCGVYPYEANEWDELEAAVKAEHPRVESQLPPPFDRIVPGCLETDPAARLSAVQVLQHLDSWR